ncbi:hypothetical protein BU24DRAFT_135184 [Aaosphaeria arxii CBS 175.79]|uniref:Rhodopsin domain-containing protein n=1 Tax=Aaosphaeria arxii CBS 175.79 TaxID=1450172 RepID=A0A6A5Y4Q9_9PLEO|nr:uncharacterized protein BU24DRAFT_135184 [Aaosphaeria arxii CBS 175.79]KAF2020193.1 hypothetical protein BU24DRAFT_135184 [Aaosphaeria arxii CBS 175.79]
MFAPNDLGPTVIITAYTLTSVSTLIVGLRFYCRIWVVGKFKSYDYIMLLALICTWATCVNNHLQMHYGTGQQSPPPPPPGVAIKPFPPEVLKVIREMQLGSARTWYAYQILYLADLGIIKFSVLFFYLSIATQRTFRVLSYASLIVTALATFALIAVNAFECPQDLSLALRPDIFLKRKEWGCFDLAPIYYAAAAFNIFSDAFILVLPLPLLLKLRMHTLKRVSLLLLFSIGILVPIASGIRLWSIFLWHGSKTEGRYYGAYVIFWSQVEVNVAIMCASAPSLQPLVKRIFGEVARHRSHSAYYYYGGGSHNMSEITPPRRGTLSNPDSTMDLESLPETYQPDRHRVKDNITEPHIDRDVVSVREMTEEEVLRDRVRRFASHRSSMQSVPPKSPARPHDILSHG